MEGDRLRVPIDDPYVNALGLAAICFARCEWNAVWCCEQLLPGYIATVEPKRKTAGTISQDLVNLVTEIQEPRLKSICEGPAQEFQRLVKDRNALLHGKPGTTTNGDQRLFRHGEEWTVEAVNEFSDAVTACSMLLNDLLHSHLQ